MINKQNNNKINDLIFRELIKRGYSLEGNTKIWNIADSKLWYLTPDQAQSFLDLESSKDYQKDIIQKEIDLINDNIGEILKNIGTSPMNIIDLGCGDGKKAEILINHIKGKLKLRYCPIDISSYMIEKTIDRLSKLNAGEVVKFQWNVSDFENLDNISSLLRYGEFKKNFILLLGNTLGNFEIKDLLYKARVSMKEGDLLLIGNGLNSKNSADILRSYNNPYLDNMLVKTLTQIGLKREDLRYGARFANSRVEMYYTIINGCDIKFLGKTVHFSEGEQILVAVSYKYDRHDFMSFLKLYFDDIKFFVSKDNSYSLALCRK